MSLLNGIIRALRGRDDRSKDYGSETYQTDENFEKGYEFEKYIVDLFNKDYFNIYAWTTDISGKHGNRWVESNLNPDLIMRYIPRNEKFAIECKYRSNLENGNLNWSYQDQIDRYNQFEQETSIPTFIIIGLGGNPSNPERMFCIPLKNAKYPVLYPVIFERFERSPTRRFFWGDGILR